MKRIILHKEKLCLDAKVSGLFLAEMAISNAQFGEDLIRDLFTYRIDAFIVARRHPTQTITVFRRPQRFWDWIRGKYQQFIIEVNAKEVMLDPPAFPEGESVMLYEIREKTA